MVKLSPIGNSASVDRRQFADQFHVGENARVAGVVDRFAGHGDEKAAGVAGIFGLFADKGAAVMGNGELDLPEGKPVASADMHRVNLRALFFAVLGEFKGSDDRSIALFGNGDGISEVVAVTMGDQNRVNPDFFGVGFRDGIAGQERDR